MNLDAAWAPLSDDLQLEALRTATADEARRRILSQNPGHDHRRLLSTPTWDIGNYNRKNSPALVAILPESVRGAFSTQRGDRVQDLCFRMPGQGWKLPRLLEPYLDAIRLSIEAERALNDDFAAHEDAYYAYITIDQKLVPPHRTQRRQGFHGDAFMTPENADLGQAALSENTYLICDALPTEFKPGPFDITDVYPDIAGCLARFDEISASQPTILFPPYALIRITPFDVHSPAVNHADLPFERTFVKITFSRERFNREGNALNPLLRYENWFWVPRSPGIRNLRNVIVDWDRADADDFLAVHQPTQLSPEWCDLAVFWAYKTESVQAERARKGQALLTTVDGFAVSVNIAQDGDWLITTRVGDQYFLSDEKRRARYHGEPAADGTLLPSPEPLPMVRITRPIRFRAPWGAMQYVPAGSVLVLKHNDVYAIHASNFAASYRRLDADADAGLGDRVIGIIRDIAERAADMLRTRRVEAAASAKLKGDASVVTPLDYEVQRLYVEALFAEPALRGHIYVVGEENFSAAGISRSIIDQNRMAFGNAELVVVIDPLDNTRGYAGAETVKYATVVAVLRRGVPIYYIAIAPEADERYECTIDGATWNGQPVPPFRDALCMPQRLLAVGLYWLTPHDPLAPILPQHFEVTDRFGSVQLAVARMIRREPDLPSFDGVITSGAPYHETIPIGAILHLAGSATVRANGLSFFPIQWSDLVAPRPHQLIGGCTAVVNATRQLRIENPVQPPSVPRDALPN
jgi:fructose-1,6-bisphosphatase/inositol monophosphatase family enzyme